MPPFNTVLPATIQVESGNLVRKWSNSNPAVIGITAVVSITGVVLATIFNPPIFVLISSLYFIFKVSTDRLALNNPFAFRYLLSFSVDPTNRFAPAIYISTPNGLLNALKRSTVKLPDDLTLAKRLFTISSTLNTVDKSAIMVPSSSSVSGFKNSLAKRVKSTCPFISARIAGFLQISLTSPLMVSEVFNPINVSSSKET